MTALYYSAGTVSLTNGNAVVTGIDTAWETALVVGGEIYVQAEGNPLPITSVDSDTLITAALVWTGATGVYDYVLRVGTAYDEQIAKNAEILARLLSEIEAGTIWKFDASGDTAGRDLYDARPKGFGYLDISGEKPALWVKASNVEGDWNGPFAYGVGPVGPMGPIGTLNPRGAYSAGTTYAANDNVLYNGSSFVALQTTTGNAPPTLPTTQNAYWSLLALKGQDGLGTGDVVGPTGSVDSRIAAFSGTTGKLIKDSGVLITALPRADAAQTFTPAEKGQAIANIGAGQLSGFRNLIINPLCGVNQRNKSGTVVLTAGNYGHDRFRAGASGCTYTFATNNGVTTLTITAGSIQQVIEGSNFSGRQGEYVLSWAGTAQGRIGAGSYGTSGVPRATCDGSANVTVEWGTGTLSLPQFERDFVSDFSARSVGQEVLICERYCQVLGEGLYGAAWTTTQIFFAMTTRQVMRDNPNLIAVASTVTLQRPSLGMGATVTRGSTIGASVNSRGGWWVWQIAAGSLTQGEPLGCATANLLRLEAEL